MLNANILNLTDPALREKSERYESFRDGGGGMVLKEDVILKEVEINPEGEGVKLKVLKDGGFAEGTFRAMELPEDWADQGSLKTSILNGPTRVKVEVSLLGARNRMVERHWVDAGERLELEFDLRDLPLIAGRRPPYQPTGLRLKVQWGETYATDGALLVENMQWKATENNEPVEITWEGAQLLEKGEGDRPVVDRFGQRISGEWPTKIHSAEHFESVKAEEEAWLKEQSEPEGRSSYGGDTTLPRQEATGFFHVKEVDGVWWYVDPEGYLFWSVGTTGIRVSDTTLLEGCEGFFEELPEREGSFAPFYDPPIGSPANDGKGKEVVSFYLLNVLRKYGSLEAWRDRVIQRFKIWGYNTFGNWSDELMMAQKSVPHTRSLSSRFDKWRFNNRMPDVFDGDWEKAFDEYLEGIVSNQKDNPWLLGYFVDNEMPWGGVAKKFLDCEPDAAIRTAFANWAEEHYEGDLATFNADFGWSLGAFGEAADKSPEDLPTDGKGEEACVAFAGYYAEHYFEKVNRLLKKHDPNHLYLGCRFVRRRPLDGICVAAGNHCDVVTVNCYSMIPDPEEFGAWHRSTGRPIQIGEHHLPLESERQRPPLYPAFTSDERRVGYERFLRVFSEQPYSLGAHWFQHADQNATGRPSDGENQTVGFVDITDRPHPDLVGAAMAVTRNMYQWHKDSNP